jgi:uncharacterized protein YndB with AHSA1/START domain
MNDFETELTIAAPPSAVYEALTTQTGLRNWWTRTCQVPGTVSSHSTFRFGPTYKIMEILAANPHREVRWRCIDSHIHAPGLVTKPDEWKGTTIHFKLTPAPAGTLLHLTHLGLTPHIECYNICTQGWHHFLASLQAYTQTGTGTPYTDPTT